MVGRWGEIGEHLGREPGSWVEDVMAQGLKGGIIGQE